MLQIHVEPPAAANDMMLWMLDRNDEVLGLCNFSTEIFEARTIERILRSFVTLLQDLIKHPEKTVDELTTLAEEDREELEQLTSDATPSRALEWLHDGLLRRESVTPDAIAYAQGSESLSYRALATRARSIAYALCEAAEAAASWA